METVQRKMHEVEDKMAGKKQGTDAGAGTGTGTTTDPSIAGMDTTGLHRGPGANLGVTGSHPGAQVGTDGAHNQGPGIKEKVAQKVQDATHYGAQKVEDIKHH